MAPLQFVFPKQRVEARPNVRRPAPGRRQRREDFVFTAFLPDEAGEVVGLVDQQRALAREMESPAEFVYALYGDAERESQTQHGLWVWRRLIA